MTKQFEKDDLMKMLESLTPGGSEFHDNPELCVSWVRQRLTSVVAQVLRRKDTERINKELLAALEEIASMTYSDAEDIKYYKAHLFDSAQKLVNDTLAKVSNNVGG